jgi:hypothetical protein
MPSTRCRARDADAEHNTNNKIEALNHLMILVCRARDFCRARDVEPPHVSTPPHPTPLQMMHAMAETPNQQVTVLSQVLASEVNIGYEEIINMQVCVPRLLAPAAG